MTKRANKGWSKRLEDKLLSELPDVMKSAMLRVESEAKNNVYQGHPDHLDRQTGTLGRSITTEVHNGDDRYDMIVTTGTNIVYAPTHEFGDDRIAWGKVMVHIPARPFLIPAFQAKKKEVRESFKNGLKKIIDTEKIN